MTRPAALVTRTCRCSEGHFPCRRTKFQQLFLSFALARGDGQVFRPWLREPPEQTEARKGGGLRVRFRRREALDGRKPKTERFTQ